MLSKVSEGKPLPSIPKAIYCCVIAFRFKFTLQKANISVDCTLTQYKDIYAKYIYILRTKTIEIINMLYEFME